LTAPLLHTAGGRDDILLFVNYFVHGTKQISEEDLIMAIQDSFQSDREQLLGTIAGNWFQEGHQEGRQEGLNCGELIGKIRAFQEFLGDPIEEIEQLSTLEESVLKAKLDHLRARHQSR
jgi:predicted transposase YdaD